MRESARELFDPLWPSICPNDNDVPHTHTHTQPPGCLPACLRVCVSATLFVLWARPPLGPSATLQPTFCRSAASKLLNGTRSRRSKQASSERARSLSSSHLPPSQPGQHFVRPPACRQLQLKSFLILQRTLSILSLFLLFSTSMAAKLEPCSLRPAPCTLSESTSSIWLTSCQQRQTVLPTRL